MLGGEEVGSSLLHRGAEEMRRAAVVQEWRRRCGAAYFLGLSQSPLHAQTAVSGRLSSAIPNSKIIKIMLIRLY